MTAYKVLKRIFSGKIFVTIKKKNIIFDKYLKIFSLFRVNMFKDRSKKCKIGANGAKLGHFAYCECCDWYASKKYNWERHLLTKTHQKKAFKSVQNSFKNVQKGCKQQNELLKKAVKKTYVCEYCNKEYKNRNGLWYHKKKCEYKKMSQEESEEESEEEKPTNDFVKIPKEIWDVVGPLIKNGTNNTTNTNCNNTYNNNITVQVYLDDHCKDAKTVENLIGRLAKEVKYKLEDVVYKSNLQFIKDAPSELFIKERNKMPAEERPIHCADGKRGKFWVNKEKEGWVQEDVKEGGKLNKEIFMFKHKLYQDVNYDIMHTDEDCDKLGNVKLKLHREIIEKSTVDNAIIAKLATNCNIKDAIKDIEVQENGLKN